MTQENRLTQELDPRIAPAVRDVEQQTGLPYAELRAIFSAFNQRIRQVCERERVLLIDLDSSIPHNEDYIYDFVHLNDRGSEQAAELIADALTPLLESLAR